MRISDKIRGLSIIGPESNFNLDSCIMDLCNERGQTKNSFGFNTSEYRDIIYYPNFNRNKFILLVYKTQA